MLLRTLSPILAASALAGPVEFNRDIRPILSDRRFFCHGPDNTNREANLWLDLESAAKANSIVVPGDPAKSKLFARVASDNKTLRMPPTYAGHDKLSQDRIALIKQWIEEGAKWQDHSSFIPPKRAPGATSDNLVRARLEREGLQLSPEADRRTLIRRLTLDLTGLPPTPAEADAFVNDSSPGFYRKAVHRLLDSPAYAERMAIRWLEAARYGRYQRLPDRRRSHDVALARRGHLGNTPPRSPAEFGDWLWTGAHVDLGSRFVRALVPPRGSDSTRTNVLAVEF